MKSTLIDAMTMVEFSFHQHVKMIIELMDKIDMEKSINNIEQYIRSELDKISME